MKKTLSIALVWLIAAMSSLPASAELWTPVGEAQWEEGIVAYDQLIGKSWPVIVEQSDERPTIFRMQPYYNHPASYKYDKVYVYVHTGNPNGVYIEPFKCLTSYSDYSYVSQRCPENGYDNIYYGKITNNMIVFPIGCFDVNWVTVKNFYSSRVHRIVFPEGVLGSVPVLESWVNIGQGKWEEGIIRNHNNDTPEAWDVAVEKSSTRPDVYRISPYASDGAKAYFGGSDPTPVYIHTEDPEKVYIEPYKISSLKITQQCGENAWTGTQSYGRLADGRIELPGSYFSVENMGETYLNTAGGTTVITLPGGYDKPIDENYGIFLGLTAFNQEVKTKPIFLLNASTKGEFIDFVNSLEPKIGTLLYYSVDQAIASFKAQVYPETLNKVVLVTFTDGLDQGSRALAPEYLTPLDYTNHLSGLIADTKIDGIGINAYSIGLKGPDVDEDDMDQFMINLNSIASAPENALTVSDMASVKSELDRIVDELARTSVKREISVTVPMPYEGDRIRFTLDKASTDISTSSLWIEGTFSADDLALHNIVCNGLTCGSGKSVTGVQSGIFLNFTFDDCRDTDGNPLAIEKGDIDHWKYIPSRDKWQHNSEIDKDQQINIEEIHTSTAIIFALDCSSSLGDEFPSLQSTAISFIERLAGGQSEESSIGNIMTDEIPEQDADAVTEYYNLQGIRVANPSHGLYIRRCGKKVDKVIL